MTSNLRNDSRMRLDRVGKLIEENVMTAACRRFLTNLGRCGLAAACALTLLAATWAPALTQVGRKSRQSSATSRAANAGRGGSHGGRRTNKIGGPRANRRRGAKNPDGASDIASITPKPPAAPPSLQPYEFETVKFNANGTIAEKLSRRAESFTEDLGDGVKLVMVKVPGSTFQMGTADSKVARVMAEQQRYCGNENCRAAAAIAVVAETPQRAVTVPSFLIGAYEVTQAQWRAVAGMPKVSRALPPDPSKFKGPDRPVDSVSWEEATEFCERLSRKAGRKYRLPTEAEWEYACRAETTTEFAFGDTIFSDDINYDGNYPYENGAKGIFSASTRAVAWGRRVFNGFGLSGMHGNVMEWCQDQWHDSYNGGPADARARASVARSPSADRVVRGGSWSDPAGDLRSAFRRRLHQRSRPPTVGLRVVTDGA